MLSTFGIVREAAQVVANAANLALEGYRDGATEQEPSLTDRMLGRIEGAMDALNTRGVKWQAKTLTDRGPGAQESEFGADSAGVFSVDLDDYRVAKGFLAQAKRLEWNAALTPAEFQRTRDPV